MTALWLEQEPRASGPLGPPDLRLLGSGVAARPEEYERPAREESYGLRLVGRPEESVRSAPRRRTSVAVRRRRTLLAAMGILVVALALPLSGTGGHSHATGSALAETGAAATYTVKPGDTLWTIAERVDPTADPRPLVAKLAEQTGSDAVVPGEQIVLP